MSDRPIIFSPPMVRALLAGTKTQTRRMLKPIKGLTLGQVIDAGERDGSAIRLSREQCADPIIRDGDRLWVRENFQIEPDGMGKVRILYPADVGREGERQIFAAVGSPQFVQAERLWTEPEHLRPSIHMPRWASRLTLIVTAVKVERLQAITPFDARQEGVIEMKGGWYSAAEGQSAPDPRAAYGLLWNSINGPGSWDANPFVAAYTFTFHHQNIDQMEAA